MRIRHFFGVSAVLLGIAAFAAAATADWSHPPIEVKKGAIRVGTGKEAEEIADITTHCLECHGPDIGASESEAEAPTPSHAVGGAGRSHPVNVAYPEAGGELVPRSGLDPRLLLIDGQMTCITCHDPAAPDRSLVLTGQGSQLCLACHQR